MRIITPDGNRDYYDTAGWADQSVVFTRRAYKGGTDGRQIWDVPFLWPAGRNDHTSAQEDYTNIKFGVCVVAGEIYPYACVTRHSWEPRHSVRDEGPILSRRFVYDADEALAALSGLRRNPWRDARYGDPAQFFGMPKDILAGWAAENGAATAILRNAGLKDHTARADRASGVINCSGLGDRELYTVLDPATAHMRIHGYISGVLGTRETTVEISDASKVVKAGFDKQSFRTRPGTKKPRAKRA